MIQAIDDAVLFFFGNIQSPFLTTVMKIIVLLTDRGLIWTLLGIALLFFARTRRAGITTLTALIISAILCNFVLKLIFDRARPFETHDLQLLTAIPYGSSFPSGHTTTAFASAVALWLENRKIGLPAIIFSVIVAMSRLYFQVHYLTDVLAGAVSGILFALLAYYLVDLACKRWKFPFC